MNTPRIQKITVQRAEGPSGQDFDLHIFEGLECVDQADQFLSKISETAPREGGYHKVDVKVTLLNGEEYGLRHDVKHWLCPDNDTCILTHLRRFMERIEANHLMPR